MDKLEIYERAWRRKGGDRLPKKQPIERLDNFILITEENRKQYVKLGNSLWTIKIHRYKKSYDIMGMFPVVPCLKKGYWYYKDDPCFSEVMWVYAPEDYSYKDWVRSYKSVINWGIKLKNLYYDPACPKVKWKFSEVRLIK